MIAFQETGIPAISLPNGANNLPPSCLPWLEKFQTIYLWMDNDETGQGQIEAFTRKLGLQRTKIVNMNIDIEGHDKFYKDANEAYLSGVDLKNYIRNSYLTKSKHLLSIIDLKDDIVNRIFNFKEIAGVKNRYFTWFNDILKGFRRGELTILTGQTGAGKTTFLSQYTLGFLEAYVPTLWGSFEIKNEIMGTTMLHQFAKVDLTNKTEALFSTIEELDKLPLKMTNYYGSTDPDELFATLDYAVYEHDVAHIVLDNLQFMLQS